ncbi:hypothetical protein EDB85DRAFT_1941032 [Lactarius pseudohatsudake]|nr:hypothetical protein EDB85DRAFT_1941032 [Lactarius pseudohatsudake]
MPVASLWRLAACVNLLSTPQPSRRNPRHRPTLIPFHYPDDYDYTQHHLKRVSATFYSISDTTFRHHVIPLRVEIDSDYCVTFLKSG